MNDLKILAPDLILSAGGTIVLLLGALRGGRALHDFLRWISVIFLVAAGIALYALRDSTGDTAVNGWLTIGSLNLAFSLVFLVIVGWTMLSATLPESDAGEWYGILLFAAVGLVVLARLGNLAGLFLGIEILSLSLYILIAFRYRNALSLRAGAMYLVLAGFASGFLVFGLALVYAAYGTLQLQELQQAFQRSAVTLPALIGFGLFLVGIGFKLSLVPFHMWAPEIYEAAPSPVSGFIASASKGAVLAAFVPFMFILRSHWQVLWMLAVASVIGGNLLALRENRVKRILAYSSIGHIGYLLIGYLAGWATAGHTRPWSGHVLAWDGLSLINNGVYAVAFYIVAYAAAILGAFAVLSVMERDYAITLRDLRGLARTRPVLSACMMIFVISLAGLPPTAGFFGKLYLFTSGVSAGYVWLAVLGLVGSAIGVFYYLRILVHLFMMPTDPVEPRIADSQLQNGLLVFTAVGIVVLGLFPDMLVPLFMPQ